MPVEFNKFRDPKEGGILVATITVDVSERLASVGLPAKEITAQCLQLAQAEFAAAVQAVQAGHIDQAKLDAAKATEKAAIDEKYAKINPPTGIDAADVAAALAESVEVK